MRPSPDLYVLIYRMKGLEQITVCRKISSLYTDAGCLEWWAEIQAGKAPDRFAMSATSTGTVQDIFAMGNRLRRFK